MTNADASAARPARPLARSRAIIVGALLGLVSAAAAVPIWMWFTVDRIPTLTETVFGDAMDRWNRGGPSDYDMDVLLGGNRPGKVHVEVRDQEVIHMIRDGVEPSQKRTWDYWSVPGMFDTISRELELARNPSGAFAPSASQVVLLAEFDPQYGYPKRFRRIVLGGNFEVDWTVIRFEVSEKKSPEQSNSGSTSADR